MLSANHQTTTTTSADQFRNLSIECFQYSQETGLARQRDGHRVQAARDEGVSGLEAEVVQASDEAPKLAALREEPRLLAPAVEDRRTQRRRCTG